jgi:ATP synthase protein I
LKPECYLPIMRGLCVGHILTGPGSLSTRLPSATVDFAAVRRQALMVVGGQVAVAVCGGLICYLGLDKRSAVSALIGGSIGAASTLAQVVVGLRNSVGEDPQAVMRSFLRGSALKLVVTVVLFVLALRGRELAPAPLLVTYVATFFVYWVALARTLKSGGA